ncbi:MAG TPA: CDP-alcohol phosphatidyltransferase family protein [Longimicrobiales bacterium]|nr:CDP-alcohol phosphatidyltransferase family protein [Longimicrobiales bacterium]
MRPAFLIPNGLTAFRLVLVPVFVVSARVQSDQPLVGGWAGPALWIVLAAGLSDVLDGFIARRWNLTSRIGALMDAVADKSFQFTALVTITLLGRPLFTQLPLWLLGAVFLRDFILLVGWGTMRHLKRPVSMEHEIHGRVATVLVLGLVIGACLRLPEGLLLPLAGLASLAALLSAAAYVRRGLRASG